MFARRMQALVDIAFFGFVIFGFSVLGAALVPVNILANLRGRASIGADRLTARLRLPGQRHES